jgi:hypothetical protein
MMIEFSSTVTRHRRSEICQSRSGYVSTNLALQKGRAGRHPAWLSPRQEDAHSSVGFADAALPVEASTWTSPDIQAACLLSRPNRSRH